MQGYKLGLVGPYDVLCTCHLKLLDMPRLIVVQADCFYLFRVLLCWVLFYHFYFLVFTVFCVFKDQHL